MARSKQPKATKGSQKWIQKLINEKPSVLNREIQTKLGIIQSDEVSWLSPLKSDDYAEYKDEAFLELLCGKLEVYPLKDFWPKQGPQWDALGKSSRGSP